MNEKRMRISPFYASVILHVQLFLSRHIAQRLLLSSSVNNDSGASTVDIDSVKAKVMETSTEVLVKSINAFSAHILL